MKTGTVKKLRRGGPAPKKASKKKKRVAKKKSKQKKKKGKRPLSKKTRKNIRWHQRHAGLFLETFRRIVFFKELLRAGVKPEVLNRLDLRTLRLEDTALLSKYGYAKRVDLLFSVQLKTATNASE